MLTYAIETCVIDAARIDDAPVPHPSRSEGWGMPVFNNAIPDGSMWLKPPWSRDSHDPYRTNHVK